MIDIKKKTEGLLIATSMVIASSAVLLTLFCQNDIYKLLIFGSTIILASWLELINSINNHRWPKSNFLISGEFLVGAIIVIYSLSVSSIGTGLLGSALILYGIFIILQTDLWPGFSARFISIATSLTIIVSGILFLSNAMTLDQLIIWVLGARTVFNFLLSFMRVRY